MQGIVVKVKWRIIVDNIHYREESDKIQSVTLHRKSDLLYCCLFGIIEENILLLMTLP